MRWLEDLNTQIPKYPNTQNIRARGIPRGCGIPRFQFSPSNNPSKAALLSPSENNRSETSFSARRVV